MTAMAEGVLAPNNPYGYRVNISHPQIEPLYWRYKAWKGIPHNIPMSDAERFEFEEYILRLVEKEGPRQWGK